MEVLGSTKKIEQFRQNGLDIFEKRFFKDLYFADFFDGNDLKIIESAFGKSCKTTDKFIIAFTGMSGKQMKKPFVTENILRRFNELGQSIDLIYKKLDKKTIMIAKYIDFTSGIPSYTVYRASDLSKFNPITFVHTDNLILKTIARVLPVVLFDGNIEKIKGRIIDITL